MDKRYGIEILRGVVIYRFTESGGESGILCDKIEPNRLLKILGVRTFLKKIKK